MACSSLQCKRYSWTHIMDSYHRLFMLALLTQQYDKHASAGLCNPSQHYSTAQHSTAQLSTAQHSTAQHSTAQHSTALHCTALLCSALQHMLQLALVSNLLCDCLLPCSSYLHLSMQGRKAPDCLPGERAVHTCDGLYHQRTRISSSSAARPGAWADPVHSDEQRGKDVCKEPQL